MKILVFKDGSAREITGEQGKYWLTGDGRVRKLSKQIAEIREEADPVEIKREVSAVVEPGIKPDAEAPKKKAPRKKSKKEATEA